MRVSGFQFAMSTNATTPAMQQETLLAVQQESSHDPFRLRHVCCLIFVGDKLKKAYCPKQSCELIALGVPCRCLSHLYCDISGSGSGHQAT